MESRLQSFPISELSLEHPLKIHWSKWGVPHIEASSDRDLAYGQGLVHAHLRAGQMELFRRLASGRLSESVGFIGKDIDQALRVLGFGRAVPEIKMGLPPETLSYLESFVEGFNAYMNSQSELPHEYKVLNWGFEEWQVEDVLLLSRLAATDVNWISFASYLATGAGEESQKAAELLRGLSRFHKSGSNSWVVSGKWTKSGKPLIANDPHLGLSIPNFWMLVGLHSPSYKAVGFSIPGLPFIALGRNEKVSWGGTNMRSQSSDLVELTEQEFQSAQWVEEKVGVRFTWDTTVRYRMSEWGPVLNDVKILDELPEKFALKWRGHESSDEVSAFLRAMRSKNVVEFKKAFRGYAVSGQTFVAADVEGNIGLVRAVELPLRKRKDSYPVLTSQEAQASWRTLVGSQEIPGLLNPREGFISSANEEPQFATPVLGYDFAPPQRKMRIDRWIQEKISQGEKFEVEDFQSLQGDTYSQMSFDLSQLVLQLGLLTKERSKTLLQQWDGHYKTDREAAVFFQAYLANLAPHLIPKSLEQGSSAQILAKESLEKMQREETLAQLREKSLFAEEKALRVLGKYPSWGDFHRLNVSHPLGNAPLIGSKYRFEEFGVDGGVETLFKTAHALTDEKHSARYGAQARHISDLADLDSNHFVLFGGNDGWLFSENFLDQVPLWRGGELISVPLQVSTAAKQSVRTQSLISVSATTK
jgi:penicillin amidase